ncbi:MAG TPA: oxygenase MpaB family protein [Terriglobales bacterium]|nr:oxygenase MpaB family protein [Terriglobales bacterium]
MNTPIVELNEMIAAQADQIPSMYGRVDFSMTPERFTEEPGDETELPPQFASHRAELLANKGQVARIKAYTMHGDPVSDAYAALSPQYGFHQLIVMLEDACAHGVENVAAAPPELVRFMAELERFPTWLDMKLIEEGARVERNAYAHRAPFVIRGGLIATFMNKYSALPMALTGSLSNKTAGRRVHETATFFTTTVMPGALERRGAGFKAAAMVRLMHSMVRFNILHRGNQWDVKTYGIPIPQVDQMPVGFVSIFPDALKARREGRTAFTAAERARVEIARYRCFLLGLPEELLVDTPEAIVSMMLTRFATLRKGFDDTCKALVHATITADLAPDHSWRSRLHAWLESGFFKMFFLKNTMRGDKEAAARVGVQVGVADSISAAAAGLVIAATMAPYAIAAHIPLIRDAADRSLVRKLTKLLASYGHAEFTTNAANYRPAHA